MGSCCKKSEEDTPRIPRKILIFLFLIPIRLYQYIISPLLGPKCRFVPTCSYYAEESIKTHGIFKGCYYAIRRILKCHPWHPGGLDPVPKKHTQSN